MKKSLCVLLMLALVLSMTACAPAPQEQTTAPTQATTTAPTEGVKELPAVFMAGYCKMNITPAEYGVPMQGYDNDDARLSNGLYTYLYATTLAVRDEAGSQALVISVDSGSIQEEICTAIREAIQAETGIPVENILITAIHQHSTPAFYSAKYPERADEYRNFMKERIVQSAKDALDDLAPAELYIATIETEGLTFVKHYKMADGSYAGDLYGSFSKEIVGHESEADNDLQLVKIDRAGQTTVDGKEAKSILLSNFQGHPHTGTSSSDPNLSADAPGIYREAVEAATDYHVMYVSGAQGNLNMSSRIVEENNYGSFKERGEALAKYAINAKDEDFTKVNTGKVQGAVVTYEGKTDHSMDDLVPEATKIDAVWASTFNSSEAMKLATSGRVHSVYHATAIIAKAKEGPTKPMPVIAISFGDIAICGGMYEMFDTNGMEIKADSPFAMTFTAHMANGAYGYIPSKMSYENGCYPADITRFAKGTGEELRDVMLQMLNTQRQAQ